MHAHPDAQAPAAPPAPARMQRVLVLGSGGAGKSTLAQTLAARTGLPLAHLDRLYWQPGWVEPPKPAWRATLAQLIAQPAWILDGNYGGTLEDRLAACDTVLLIDVPTHVCLWRIVKRRWLNAGRARPDMAPGCPEKLDWPFVWWVATYRRQRLPALRARLRALPATTRVQVLRHEADLLRWLATLSDERPPSASASLQL